MCAKIILGSSFSTTISIEKIKLFPLHIISCQQPHNDLVFLQGDVLCKKPPLLFEIFYWQTKEGYPLRHKYITGNDYGPGFRRDMRACFLHMLPFLDEASKKRVSLTVDGTYYDYEAMLLLKEKELFLDTAKAEFSAPPPAIEETIGEGLMVIVAALVAGTHLLTRLHPELSAQECIKQATRYLSYLKIPDAQTTQELEKVFRDGKFNLAQMTEILDQCNTSASKEYYTITYQGVIIGRVKHLPVEN